MIVDSGQIQDGTITGGRVGVIQYGRFSSIWSNLNVECLMETNKALTFNGLSDYIELTTFPNLVDVNEHQQYKLGKRLVFLFLAHLSTECSLTYCDHSMSVDVCLSVHNFLVNTLASTNINQSAPNFVKMYMIIRSQMTSIMELIGPELSELSALELENLPYFTLFTL